MFIRPVEDWIAIFIVGVVSSALFFAFGGAAVTP